MYLKLLQKSLWCSSFKTGISTGIRCRFGGEDKEHVTSNMWIWTSCQAAEGMGCYQLMSFITRSLYQSGFEIIFYFVLNWSVLTCIWLLGRIERGKIKGKGRSRGPCTRNGWVEVPNDQFARRRVQATCLHWTNIFTENSWVRSTGNFVMIAFCLLLKKGLFS